MNMPSDAAPGPEPASRRTYDEALGYLLKHAHFALQQRSDIALAALGITGRDLGVLRVIATGGASSQQEIASLLDVDRTTMVAFIDSLERRGLVRRLPSRSDRRRNLLTLTPRGHDLYAEAETIAVASEVAFLSALDDPDVQHFVRSLSTLVDVHRAS